MQASGSARFGHNRCVAYLRLIDEAEATGELEAEYEAAADRAGKVFNIVKAMSLRPSVLHQAIALYEAVMLGPSKLTRAERELLAVVVSSANTCDY